MINVRSISFLAGAILCAASMTQANAEPGIQVGVLNCTVSGGTGFIIGSSKTLECVFQNAATRESYAGVINKFGLDVGVTTTGLIAWAVFAPNVANLQPGVLAGTYGGVTAEATVGLGVGANALLGGLDKSIALQPLSVSGQEGINIAVGIGALQLRPAIER